MATEGGKRCLYEVLGLSRECSPDEIRSAYKKMALQRHPDKLVKSGLSQAEATASFQELVNAYEVLSDPKERAWYDSHRSQILFSSADLSASAVPDLFSFFSKSVFSGFSDSGKGFFKVYSDVFDKIYSNELNFARKLGLGADVVKEAPVMGNLESPYAQVTAFYNYWLGFATVLDFCWADQYDAMAGPDRKSRRKMEEENIKARKKARREYNDTVRSLAEFVKKRDKRVADMQIKRIEEMVKKREEEKKRKKEMEREKLELAKAYVEPEWSKVEDDGEVEEEENEIQDEKKNGVKELFCVVCRKKFKSEKQWKNHEQSKKHKEKVAELREIFSAEDNEEEDEEARGGEDGNVEIDELREEFEESVQFEIQENGDEEAQSTAEEADDDEENFGPTKVNQTIVSDDDETSVLEAMISGHKKKNAKIPEAKASPMNMNSTDESDEDMDTTAYNNLKKTRRRRAAKGDRGKKQEHGEEESSTANKTKVKSEVEEINVHEDDVEDQNLSGLGNDETIIYSSVEKVSDGVEDQNLSRKSDVSKKTVKKKGSDKKDTEPKLKNSSKGKKQKATSKSSQATSKSSASMCDTCGEDFESRSRLFKHLGESGHATVKSR